MKKLDVISIGAVLLDTMATVERFPDIDDEVFVPELVMSGGGSAANVAISCSRLGMRTGFIGKIGDDSNGEFLKNEFKADNIDLEGLVIDKKFNTGMCFIPIHQGERMIFAHSGAANKLNQEDIKKEYILSSKLILLANLKNLKPLKQATKYAKTGDTLVVFNPGALIADQGFDECEELLASTDIYISSETELNKIMEEKSTESSLNKLFKMGTSVAAITRGSRGALLVDKNKKIEIPIYKVNVVDTTGAGDSFSAGFITGYLENIDLKMCGKMGNANAAILIGKVGARNELATRDKLENFIKNQT